MKLASVRMKASRHWCCKRHVEESMFSSCLDRLGLEFHGQSRVRAPPTHGGGVSHRPQPSAGLVAGVMSFLRRRCHCRWRR